MSKEKYISENSRKFIDSLFEYDLKVLDSSKFGSIKMSGEDLNGKEGYEDDYRIFMYTHMLSMRKKYGFKLGYGDDFLSEYSVALSVAVSELGDRFPDFEEFKNDKKIQMKTMKYLKQSIQKHLYTAANPDMLQTRNGKQNVFIHADVASIDELEENSRKNDTYFELDDSNRLHKIDEDEYYQFNALVRHFLENRTRILTKKQNDFYEKMREAYIPENHEVTKTQAFKEAGYTLNQFNRYKKEILKRTLADFEKFGEKKSLSSDSRTKLHKVFRNFVETANTKLNPHLTQLNLTVAIRENYENEDFEVVILKGLTTEEKIHVVRVVKGKHYVSNEVAYKITRNIEEYLEKNPLQEVKPSEAKSTYTEAIFSDAQRGSDARHYKLSTSGVVVPADFVKEQEVI